MSDEQDRAEAVDEEEIAAEYPPERPLGVDEAQTPDSFAERTLREDGADPDDGRPVVQPYAEDDLLDDEAQLVADAAVDERDPEADGQPVQAEEAALHLEG